MNGPFLATCAVGLLMFVLAWRRSARLNMDLDRLASQVHDLKVFVNVSHERLKQEVLSQVQGELRRGGNGPAFHRNMSVGEVIKLHPQAAAVMAGFHLGGCSSCNISDNHILGDAARDYGVNIDSLLVALNGLFDGTTRASPETPQNQTLQIQPAN